MFLCIVSTFGQVNQMEKMVAQKLKDANPILLPQQAGALMTQARPADRLACATAILRYVVQHRPTSALVVLRAVVEAAPDQAQEVALLAAALLPGRVLEIARTVAEAAPRRAALVAAALCRAYPLKMDLIARQVLIGVPQASADLLVELGRSLPGLQPVLQRRMRSLGRAADTPYMVISLISRSLAEINTAAELITATINQSISDPHAKVSFADVAAAILKDQISIGPDGQISSINVTAISSPKLQTALTVAMVNQVSNEVNTAAQDPESPYGSALVQATTSPMESVAAGEAVEVGEDYARKYSRP